MTTERAMGEPFFGTGKPPEGYRRGDYVQFLSHHSNAWCHMLYEPDWATDYQYRLPADHPYYLPPIWCLDKAAKDAGWDSWKQAVIRTHTGQPPQKSIIAHARTLQHGCEPMQEPVDPLLLAMREAYAKGLDAREYYHSANTARSGHYDDLVRVILDELRARFDIKPRGEAK